jgi:hypothetical protein
MNGSDANTPCGFRARTEAGVKTMKGSSPNMSQAQAFGIANGG